MRRAVRVFVAQGVVHVVSRLARDKRVFEDDHRAQPSADTLREVARRDEPSALAWCVMADHYHLAVRTGAVLLERPEWHE